MQHVGIEQNLLDAEALVEIEQRLLDGRLEVDRIVGARLKHAMGDQARLVVVPRDGDDRGTVVLDARVDADPDRHQAIGEHRLGSRIDAGVPRLQDR